MKDNIRKTLISIIDLYNTAGSKFYGFSLAFLIASAFFSILVVVMLYALLWVIMIPKTSLPENLIEAIQMNPFFMRRFEETVYAVIYLNFGLYSIFLLKEEKKGWQEKYRLKNLFGNISSRTWMQYFILLGSLLLAHGLFYKYIFDIDRNNPGLTGLISFFESSEKEIKFFVWLNSIIELIKYYLPYFLAMLLLLWSMKDAGNLKKYRAAIGTALILCFCIVMIWRAVADYVDYYFIDLIRAPFNDQIIPTLIGYILGILVGAFFFLGFAATIAYPFKHAIKPTELQGN